MELMAKLGQPSPAPNIKSDTSSPFVFPMAVLFGTYAFWIVLAGIILLVLNIF